MRFAKLCVLALSSMLALTACQASVSAEQTKAKLEEKDYTVTVMSGEKFDSSTLGEVFPMTIGLENFLTATRETDGEYLIAWYFLSIEDATSFSDLYSNQFSEATKPSLKSAKSGTKNNCVYYGTDAAVSDSGLGSLF